MNEDKMENAPVNSRPFAEQPLIPLLPPAEEPVRPMDRRRRLRIEPVKKRKQDPVERLKNFEEVSQALTLREALIEASRCLQCEHHPCTFGCPAHNDIPGALWLLEQGDVIGAAKKFFETSNLPDICGRLCPQEKQCEGSCVVGTYSLPVAIGKLEAFCVDYTRKVLGTYPKPELPPPLGTRVAVVGSGPAGLAVAEELVRRGHKVTVFEAWPRPGGLLIYGIPGFKLNKEIVWAHIRFLEELGVEFVCNTRIGKELTVDQLLRERGFDAVFLGHGACATNRMKIPGEELKNVYNATEYLVRGNLPFELLPEGMRERPHAGLRTVVVGGGDTAMDCVRTARRLRPEGEVWCVYRRSEVEMPGRLEERINAREEGVKFEMLTLPVKFIGDEQGRVKACECIRMKLGKPDAKGRRTPVPIEGSNFVLECDTAVIAIGYSVDDEIAETTENLKTTKWGTIWVNSEEEGETSREEEIWAAGDCVRGADLIVTAMAPARKAAQSIDRALRKKLQQQGKL
ncbi:MAG TPA: NAD(P)-dependent oxidoreductase [Candidatus Nitrosotenuis sp.]|nr:NAD(P)-dependent oxidoreductase [Candidatus Nitrosotenuis sp.]